MKYDYAYSHLPDNFIAECNRYLAKGWIPQGGIAVTTSMGGERTYYQAFMVPDENAKAAAAEILKSLVAAAEIPVEYAHAGVTTGAG